MICAIFNYRGVVRLSKDISRKLALTNKPQMIEQVSILQPDKISYWGTVESYFGPVKHSRFQIHSAPLDKPNHPFIALAKVEVGHSLGQMTKNMFAELASLAGDKVKEGSAISEIKPDYNSYLQSAYLRIEPSQLRLDLDTLLPFYSQTETEKETLTAPVVAENKPGILISPVGQIVAKILEESPKLNSRKIWQEIQRDFERESPRYDTGGVISEITDDTLKWFGQGVESENDMAYPSFKKNIVYHVRAALKNLPS